MSKVISLRDLMKADPLAGMSQFDICHLDNLEKVNAVLAEIGFDIHKATHIYAALHRDMSGKVEVGYLLAGEYNFDRKHIKGKYSTMEDTMLAAQALDQSLFEELYGMQNRCNDYGANNLSLDRNFAVSNNEYSAEEAKITAQIEQLEGLLFHIRGSQYNNDGSVKTAADYRGPQEPEVKRLRRKSVKKTEGNVNG